MSTKHLRKLLEEKEAQKAKEKEASSSDEEPVPPVRQNRFQFLDESDEGGQKSDENETAAATSAPVTKSAKKRNKKKKQKAKAKLSDGEEEDEDQLLERLASEAKLLENEEGEDEPVLLNELFKPDPKLFDAAEELRKALGKVLKEGSTPRDGGRSTHKAGWGRIVKAKMNWPPPRSIGLSMEVDTEADQIPDVKYFKFTHNQNYEKTERLCWIAESTMNPELVNEILAATSYHLNSLLIMANVFRMQEDWTQSNDCIERGIFFCEQSFHPVFEVFTWGHRLSYDVYENRAFFLLLHRHMLNCVQKRCFKTAFNVGKLLYRLEPQDPLCMLSLIDTLALRAKQYDWVKRMYAPLKVTKKLNLLPNYVYSIALAAFMLNEAAEETDFLLQSAIIAHPGVVTEIWNVLGIHAGSEMEGNYYFRSTTFEKEPEGVRLLYKIYVNQTSELWKAPNVLAWLERVTADTVRRQPLARQMEEWRLRRHRVFLGVPAPVRRVAFLIGIDHTISSLTDPAPPENNRQRYTREEANNPHAEQSLLAAFFHSMLPDYQPVSFCICSLTFGATGEISGRGQHDL
ncbi:unnamed protein product, partial [Mesorhabditis spiculigera]